MAHAHITAKDWTWQWPRVLMARQTTQATSLIILRGLASRGP
jgi:hypothetical protein